MKNIHPYYMHKNEDLETYKRMASEGMDLMHPVRIKGKTHRHDINIPYHTTIKLFDTSKDKPEHVHEIAQHLTLNPPDPKHVHIEPTTLKGRNGNVMHVFKLHGPHADEIKEHHKKFAHLGHKENYEYSPHITVDKATWDHAVQNKFKTAHEAGIEFMPAELHHKDKVVSSYRPKSAAIAGGDAHKEDKLAASEDLQKGALKNIGAAIAMGTALASTPAPAPARAPASVHPAAVVNKAPAYSTNHMLQAIAAVESSGGKNQKHAAGGGAIHGQEHAYGKYGLMPQTIRETVGMNNDLKAKYKKATMLRGNDLHRYMQDNPGLEDAVAQRHLKRLEHHFGANPKDIAYSWLNGINGTYKAKKNKEDIGNHWHVKKVNEAYGKGK